jgi:hypothetical protein
MPTISQGQVRLQFTAAVPDQDGMVVTADVCCACWFISVMPMQHRFHQQFQYHTTASCDTILQWVTQWNLMGSEIDRCVRATKPEENQLNNRGKKSKSMLIPLISCYVNEYQIGMCEEYCTSRHFTPIESVWFKHYRSNKVNCVKFCTWFLECHYTNEYNINEWACIMMYTV